MNYPYLNDSNFLQKFYSEPLSEMFVKIILYDWEEHSIKEVQGIATGGNISIAAGSNVRRTCNLNIYLNEDQYDTDSIDALFSLNRKMEVFVGYTNYTNLYKEYEKIWFPLGFYLMISCSVSYSTSGASLTLQLRDKMSLLNGDIGGILPNAAIWSEYDTVNEKGEAVTEKPTMYRIIQEIVNHWGGEQLGKIIISDLDTRVKQYVAIGPNIEALYKKDGLLTEEAIEDYDIKYDSGADIGFKYVDFSYPDELSTAAGAKITDVLDNIKNALGNYEYFYDLNGNFRFQEIKNYLNTSHTVDLLNPNYIPNYNYSNSVWSFNNTNLITSLSNSPQYNMIKNDYCVWGQRKDASGLVSPVCYHLVIDDKPIVTDDVYYAVVYEDTDGLKKLGIPLDFNTYSDFPRIGAAKVFYHDLQTNLIYIWNGEDYELSLYGIESFTAKDWRMQLYLNGLEESRKGTSYNYYWTELEGFIPKIYNFEEKEYNKDISKLDYYIDFVDGGAEINKFNIKKVGRRPIVESNDKINCVFEPEVEDVIIIQEGDEEALEECKNKGDKYITVSEEIMESLNVGGLNNSAYAAVRELLYQHISYNNAISISCLPIYHLDVNTRITVNDDQSGIHGDYIINSITVPLDPNGIMTISANKVLERV